MDRLNGVITKLKKNHATAVEAVLEAGSAYRAALTEEMDLAQAREEALAERARQIGKLDGGETRWDNLCALQAKPTDKEVALICNDIMPALDAAISAGHALCRYQSDVLPPLRDAFEMSETKRSNRRTS